MIAVKGGVLKLHTEGGVVAFMPHGKGLHYLDLKEYGKCEAMLVSTIKGNYKGYNKN